MADTIAKKVGDTLIRAASAFSDDKMEAYRRAVSAKAEGAARWVMESICENACAAMGDESPLCDDTGIPHLFLEVGRNRQVGGELLREIKQGVRDGLTRLPGRPMAILGSDAQRLDQSGGLSEDPADVECAPIILQDVDEDDTLRLSILMQGGGPEIRAKTYRVFHKHSVEAIREEIVAWAGEGARLLGCTPCTVAVGIGRSHFEAAALMLEAMIKGRYAAQSDFEREITGRVNETLVGPLGLGGRTTVLGTFVKVGPQRASGVRIVCVRPCCCFEPRVASVEL